MKAYYFANKDNRLRYNDGRKIIVGETHTVNVKPKCCERGLHGSIDILDALKYAPGDNLYIVDITGDVDTNEDKISGTSREYLYKVPSMSKILREFARVVALKAVLSNYPTIDPIVIEYLKTGKEAIRSAAWSAARSAAESAAWSAKSAAWSAWSAAKSAAGSAAESARSAAESAAWSAAKSAKSTAWSAAESAAWSEHSKLLKSMVDKELLDFRDI